jgi:hypothetical protein
MARSSFKTVTDPQSSVLLNFTAILLVPYRSVFLSRAMKLVNSLNLQEHQFCYQSHTKLTYKCSSVYLYQHYFDFASNFINGISIIMNTDQNTGWMTEESGSISGRRQKFVSA